MIKRKMKRRKKEEREAWYSEKGKREKKNELNYKEQRIEKENIAKEWRKNRKRKRRRDLYSIVKEPIHTERKIGRRKRKKGRKITSFLESEGRRREASVSAIPGFLESNIGRRKEEEKGSVGICNSWFYCIGRCTRRSTWKDWQPLEMVGGIRVPHRAL